MSIELEHNGERYMVDGGQWYRRLKVGEIDCDGYQIWNIEQQGWSLGVRESSEITDSDRPCRVPCTDPRPPFVVGQRVKVARKDETCGYWVEDMDDLVGQSGEVFRYTAEFNGQEVPSVKFDDGDYWNFPPWCLDSVSERKEQAQ